MAAKPGANSSQVPGSGTDPGASPQGPGFFFFPVPVSPPSPPAPFFLTGAHKPSGIGGGAMGTQFPPTNGLYKASGPIGSAPGTIGRFNRADSHGAGGILIAVPCPSRTGSSNFCTGGSTGEAASCCGVSSTRLAQRVRAVIL